MYAAGDTLGARPRESRPSSVGVFTGKALGGNFACVFCRAMEWGGCITTALRHERGRVYWQASVPRESVCGVLVQWWWSCGVVCKCASELPHATF